MRRTIVLSSFLLMLMAWGGLCLAETNHDYSVQIKKEESKNIHSDHKEREHAHDDHEGGEDAHEEQGDHKNSEEEHVHGEAEHEESSFGEGKGILEVKKGGKKFKLAENVIKTLNIQSVKIGPLSEGAIDVPATTVVDFQDEFGVYLQKGRWFELIEVKVLRRNKKTVTIVSKELAEADEIVNEGLALLRVAHLQASGQGGKGHAH